MNNFEYEFKKDIINIIVSTIEYIKSEFEGTNKVDNSFDDNKSEIDLLYEKLELNEGVKHKYKMTNKITILIHKYLYENNDYYSCLKFNQKLVYLSMISKYIDYLLVWCEEMNIENKLTEKIMQFSNKIVILATNKTFHRISLFTQIFSEYITKSIIIDICQANFIKYMEREYNFEESEIKKLLLLDNNKKGGKKSIKKRKYKFKKINKNKYKYVFNLINKTKNIIKIKKGGKSNISCPLLKEKDTEKLKLNINFLNTLEEYVSVIFTLFETVNINYKQFSYDPSNQIELYEYILVKLNEYFKDFSLFNAIPDDIKIDFYKIMLFYIQKYTKKIIKFLKIYFYNIILQKRENIENIINKYFLKKVLTKNTLKNIISNSEIIIIEELEKLCINNNIKINPNNNKDFFPIEHTRTSKSHRSN